jgi:hypothetical protein
MASSALKLKLARTRLLTLTMRFSRNQIIGALILLATLWMLILYRMVFSGA